MLRVTSSPKVNTENQGARESFSSCGMAMALAVEVTTPAGQEQRRRKASRGRIPSFRGIPSSSCNWRRIKRESYEKFSYEMSGNIERNSSRE